MRGGSDAGTLGCRDDPLSILGKQLRLTPINSWADKFSLC